MARNYAALLHEYLEEMELYTDEEFGRLCRALLRYSMSGEVQELTGQEKFAWQRVKTQEDRFQTSYEEASIKRREAGKNGAAKRWDGKNGNAINAIANDGNAINAIANDGNAINAIANDGNAIPGIASDSKNSKTETKTKTETNIPLPSEEGNKRKKFAPPTVEEVAEYVAKRGSRVDPQGFIDFYEAKGWVVGKTPMKDWKAACRNSNIRLYLPLSALRPRQNEARYRKPTTARFYYIFL